MILILYYYKQGTVNELVYDSLQSYEGTPFLEKVIVHIS